MEALADDDELAARFVDVEPAKPTGPRLSDWSAEVEALYALLDRVTELIHVTAAVNGAKTGKPVFAPRPVTAVDRARARRKQRRHRDLVARVLPARPPEIDA